MEYGRGRFGDVGLEKGGRFCIAASWRKAGRGIAVRALCGNRAGERRLTRLLRDPKAGVEKIVEHARAASRVSGRHIVAIQDTTSPRDNGAGHSIQVHPTIAVDGESGAVAGQGAIPRQFHHRRPDP